MPTNRGMEFDFTSALDRWIARRSARRAAPIHPHDPGDPIMKTTLNGRSRTTRTDDAAARAHLKEAATSTRDGVMEMGSAAKEVARTEFDHLTAQFGTWRDEALEKVVEKPLKSLLIAAGAGVVVGLLLRRR